MKVQLAAAKFLGAKFLGALAALSAVAFAAPAAAQSPPPFATTKVEGTDNVYIFRNGGHQSMFVVTKDGVIATELAQGLLKSVVFEIKKEDERAGS